MKCLNLKNYEEVRQEAKLLLKYMGMYKAMRPEQVYGLLSDFHRDATRQVIIRLVYQRKLYFDPSACCFRESMSNAPIDTGMLKALWVLVDRLEKAGSHTAGDGTVKLCFEEEGQLCSVVYCPRGREKQISKEADALTGENAHAILIVDKPEQFALLDCGETVEFCTVSDSGKVTYY